MSEVLYIPGLGDERTIRIQEWWIRLVNIFRREDIVFFDPHWEVPGGEIDDVRYGRLQNVCSNHPELKSVWGASAGGSLAMRIGIENNLTINLVCAKAQGAAELGDDYEQRAPHFKESVQKSEETIAGPDYDSSKIVSYIPKGRDNDGVIKVADMVPSGASTKHLPKRLDHAPAIAYALFRHVPLA